MKKQMWNNWSSYLIYLIIFFPDTSLLEVFGFVTKEICRFLVNMHAKKVHNVHVVPFSGGEDSIVLQFHDLWNASLEASVAPPVVIVVKSSSFPAPCIAP